MFDVIHHPGPKIIVLGRKHDVRYIQHKVQQFQLFDFPVDVCMGLTTVQRYCAACDSRWPLSTILDLLLEVVNQPRKSLHVGYTL